MAARRRLFTKHTFPKTIFNEKENDKLVALKNPGLSYQ